MNIEDLRKAQLREWPDSVFITPLQALKLCRETAHPTTQVSALYWFSYTSLSLESGPLQFYLCGKQPDGKYRWMGARFGTKGPEYLSGCPINYFEAPRGE